MQEIMFFLTPVAWLLFFAASFFLIGRAISVILFKLPTMTGSFFLNSVLGMSFVISGLFVLAVFDWLAVSSVLILMLIPIVVTALFRPSIFHLQWRESVIRRHYALLAVLLAFWLSVAIRVFLPEIGADALSYHLPYAKSFAEEGGLVVETYLRYPLNTLNFNLLFTLGFLFDGEVLARMFSVYASFLMLVGIYSLGLVFFNTAVATVATWMFISSQMILNIMTSAYIDLGFALFVLAAIFAMLIYHKDQDTSRLWSVVVFLGMAMGTKYLGLLVVPSLLGWLFFLVKNKKLWAGCVALVLVVACPWYLRNWLISGNPIHPFAQALFGYWLWTPVDLLNQNSDLFQVHGVDRTVLNLIKLPWLIWQDTFVRIGPLNVLFGVSIPLALLGLFKPGVIRQLSVFVLFHVTFWFFSSQIMRYLLFVLPFLSLITAYYLVYAFQRLPALLPKKKSVQWKMSHRKQHILGLIIVAVCFYSAAKYHVKVISKDMVPSSQKEWQLMLNTKPVYQLVNIANQQESEATMKLGFPYSAHYFKNEFKGDFFGSANMVEFSKAATNGDNAARIMQEMNVSLLLIDKSYERFVKVHEIIDNSEHFELIFENDSGYLYRLKQ